MIQGIFCQHPVFPFYLRSLGKSIHGKLLFVLPDIAVCQMIQSRLLQAGRRIQWHHALEIIGGRIEIIQLVIAISQNITPFRIRNFSGIAIKIGHMRQGFLITAFFVESLADQTAYFGSPLLRSPLHQSRSFLYHFLALPQNMINLQHIQRDNGCESRIVFNLFKVIQCTLIITFQIQDIGIIICSNHLIPVFMLRQFGKAQLGFRVIPRHEGRITCSEPV